MKWNTTVNQSARKGKKTFYCEPEVDKRWHGSPRRHRPSSSKLDSITNGGDKDVTTRKTERARVDKPDTTISPPGLQDAANKDGKHKEIYETLRALNIYFITFTKQSCLSELFDPAPAQHVATWCFRDLAASLSVLFLNQAPVVVDEVQACWSSALSWEFQSLIWALSPWHCRASSFQTKPSSQLLSSTF